MENSRIRPLNDEARPEPILRPEQRKAERAPLPKPARGLDLKTYLFGKRWHITVFTTLVSLAAAIILFQTPVLYRSIVTVLVEDGGMHDLDTGTRAQPVDRAVSNLQFKCTSSAMLSVLIERYALVDHYGIDRTDPFAAERTERLLRSRIRPMAMAPGGLEIEVMDHDPAMAKDLANDLAMELEHQLSARILGKFERQAQLYSAIIERTKVQLDSNARQMMHLIADLKAGRQEMAEAHELPRILKAMDAVDMRLTRLTAELSLADNELVQAMRQQQAALAVNAQDPLPSIEVLTVAREDITTDPTMYRITIILLAGVFAALFAVGLFVLWFKHGAEFQAYWSDPREEPDGTSKVGGTTRSVAATMMDKVE
jgi:uncharacterized protein involved in exopolysaccharide biosynthesis